MTYKIAGPGPDLPPVIVEENLTILWVIQECTADM